MKRKKPWVRKWDAKPLRAPKLVRLTKDGSPLAKALLVAFTPAHTRPARHRRLIARQILKAGRP